MPCSASLCIKKASLELKSLISATSAAKNNLSIAANLITDWSLGKTQHIGNNPSPGSWMIGSSIQLIMNSSKGVLAQDLIACNEYLDAPNSAKDINQEVLIISGKEDKMTPAKKNPRGIPNKSTKSAVWEKGRDF